jgi:hypothetical protein
MLERMDDFSEEQVTVEIAYETLSEVRDAWLAELAQDWVGQRKEQLATGTRDVTARCAAAVTQQLAVVESL